MQQRGAGNDPTSTRVREAQHWVYSDKSTDQSKIHKETCRWFINRKSALLPDNWWHGPYESKDLARYSQKNVGGVSLCGTCNP